MNSYKKSKLMMTEYAHDSHKRRGGEDSKNRQRRKIRRLLLRSPFLTNDEIAEALNIPSHIVNALRNDVDKDLDEFEKREMEPEIARYEKQMWEIAESLWMIAMHNKTFTKDRVAALAQVRFILSDILKAKFDAGLFERKLGTLKTETFADFVKSITYESDERTKNQNTGNVSDETKSVFERGTGS